MKWISLFILKRFLLRCCALNDEILLKKKGKVIFILLEKED